LERLPAIKGFKFHFPSYFSKAFEDKKIPYLNFTV
jgi:hypothetical protein